jgi:hypothetical protein
MRYSTAVTTSIRIARWVWSAALFAVAIAAPATAQVVHGHVLTSTAGEHVRGAVVLLLDSADDYVRIRALSDEHGEFSFVAPYSGQYRLRALRLGFRPTTTAPLSITGDTTVTITMTDVAVELPAVTTRDQSQCRTHPEAGLATSSLWEEVKTALLAASITRDDHAYRFDVVQHTRLWDLGAPSLTEMAMREGTFEGNHSWASRPAEELRRDGYVTLLGAKITFVAPDLDVLLSPYFADTHCFRVNARSEGRPMVGLDFEPAESSRHVEIRGTLWMDRASRELRALSFYYTDLGYRGIDTLAGGVARFTHLTTGAWVLTDWSIRMPVPSVQLHGTSTVRGRVAFTADGQRWGSQFLRVTGGTVREIKRDSIALWSQPNGSVSVRVVSEGKNGVHPIANALVFVPGDNELARTDADGNLKIRRLPPGSYLLEATTDELELLSRPRGTARVDVDPDGEARVTMQVESPLAAARAMCGAAGESITDSTSALIGVALRGNGPMIDAPVTVSVDKRRDRPGELQLTRDTRTMASDGRFLVCGVPRNRALEVRVWSGEEWTATTITVDADKVAAPVTIAFAGSKSRQEKR